MQRKNHNQKPQFLLKIAYAFLVVLCCFLMPSPARAGILEEVANVPRQITDGAVVLVDEIVPSLSPASLVSAWQGFTCFFGFNCLAQAPEQAVETEAWIKWMGGCFG